MDLSEGLLIIYCANVRAKALAYLLTLVLITVLAGNIAGLLFLLVPLALDYAGAQLVKDNHNAFREDVLENLEKECLAACDVTKAQPHYPFSEISGSIDHWLLKKLKSEASFTIMAPKEESVVIAKRKGRIFPLKGYFPVAYHTEDAGTRDVFYSDITLVELSGKVLTMTTSSGEPVAYTGQGDKAAAAAEHIRRRLREFKAAQAALPQRATQPDAEELA